jgi:DNA-binding IclR family transcriptional regulator
MARDDKIESLGIQSIEVGGALLRVLAATAAPVTLSELARRAGMSPSKAHRYLASFIRIGLVSQPASNGPYGLGPLASELGFTALRRLDIFELGRSPVEELSAATEKTTSLTTWSTRGPVIVRVARSAQPVAVAIELGQVLPMLTTANGRIFGAYLPRSLTESIMLAELAEKGGLAHKAGIRRTSDVDAMIKEVRVKGFAVADGTAHKAVTSISGPIFNHDGDLIAALTVVGVKGFIDISPRGLPMRSLIRIANELSQRLGAPDLRLDQRSASKPGRKVITI